MCIMLVYCGTCTAVSDKHIVLAAIFGDSSLVQRVTGPVTALWFRDRVMVRVRVSTCMLCLPD